MVIVYEHQFTILSVEPRSRRLVQDNCPVQNSVAAKKAFKEQDISLLKIPSRSPDLNPIENLFAQVKVQLRNSALEQNIEYETKAQFTERVCTVLSSCSIEQIDKLIDSMPTRIQMIHKNKGRRLKY